MGKAYHRDSVRTSHPAAPDLIPSMTPQNQIIQRKDSLGKNEFDVAEIYRQAYLEECGQRLDNVNRTHLVLASGTSTANTLKNTLATYLRAQHEKKTCGRINFLNT